MNILTKLDYKVNIDKLLTEATEFDLIYNPERKRRIEICTTGTSSTADPFEGAGSLVYDTMPDSSKVLKATTLNEEDFVHFLDRFKGTYTEQVYNELQETFKIGRLRFMFTNPNYCNSWHRDVTPRLHIPIFTNPAKTGLIVEDTVLRLPADGSSYIIDTTRPHLAFNAWTKIRIHMVAVIL